MAHAKSPNARRELAFELLVNGVLPYVIYEQAKARLHSSETEALVWATVVPAVMILLGFVRQRKLDIIASFTIFTLVLSIVVAYATEDPRLLQLRESYLSAVLGAMMVLSALLGRPAMVYLAPRMVPPDVRPKLEHPAIRRLLTQLTWIWGLVSAGELALKWWMVEHLSIGQVLAMGPVAFMALTGIGLLASMVAAARVKARAVPGCVSQTWPVPREEESLRRRKTPG